MKEKKNIEQLFRKEFETFEVQPSTKVWRGVRSDLIIKNFFHYSPRSINAWYVGGALIIAVFSVFVFTQPNEKVSSLTGTINVAGPNELADSTYDEVTVGQVKIGSPESEVRSLELDSLKEKVKRERLKSEPSYARTRVGKAGKGSPESGAVDMKSGSQKANAKHETQIEKPVNTLLVDKPSDRFSESSKNYNGQAVLAYFKCSVPEGCVPLITSFNNFSQNSMRYLWSFGDGGSSDLVNPSYIFDEPGTWFVSLTAFSASNEISIFTDSIKVYPLPEARFSMDIQGLPGEGQPVYFYNFSRGAESYFWNFGDGSTSTLRDPDHYFSKKAQTDIKLQAFSSAGCIDSTILKDAFKEGEPAFIFPTAFSPSTTGPQSGQYSRKSPDNDIFYPFVEEEPEEYQLKIFNRNGILIFESADINIGWDGYYHEELMAQGVYVWKARAKFANGRSVVRMGDVTLLWGE